MVPGRDTSDDKARRMIRPLWRVGLGLLGVLAFAFFYMGASLALWARLTAGLVGCALWLPFHVNGTRPKNVAYRRRALRGELTDEERQQNEKWRRTNTIVGWVTVFAFAPLARLLMRNDAMTLFSIAVVSFMMLWAFDAAYQGRKLAMDSKEPSSAES
jgi:small-conductance mechanosensitive channel